MLKEQESFPRNTVGLDECWRCGARNTRKVRKCHKCGTDNLDHEEQYKTFQTTQPVFSHGRARTIDSETREVRHDYSHPNHEGAKEEADAPLKTPFDDAELR